jgi:hypothetical protein
MAIGIYVCGFELPDPITSGVDWFAESLALIRRVNHSLMSRSFFRVKKKKENSGTQQATATEEEF